MLCVSAAQVLLFAGFATAETAPSTAPSVCTSHSDPAVRTLCEQLFARVSQDGSVDGSAAAAPGTTTQAEAQHSVGHQEPWYNHGPESERPPYSEDSREESYPHEGHDGEGADGYDHVHHPHHPWAPSVRLYPQGAAQIP